MTKQNMLTAELRLLAFDPGNTDQMLAVFQEPTKPASHDTVMWMGNVLNKAIEDSGKPDFNKYIAIAIPTARLKQMEKVGRSVSESRGN